MTYSEITNDKKIYIFNIQTYIRSIVLFVGIITNMYLILITLYAPMNRLQFYSTRWQGYFSQLRHYTP